MSGYLPLIVGVLLIVSIVVGVVFVRARSLGERQYRRYDDYTKSLLAKHFELHPHEVKREYQTIHPWKALKLFKIVLSSQEGKRVSRVNSLNATMGGFMKMYTLLLRPDFRYNLPVFSVDLVFIGSKRVFVIEIIDPAHIEDDNKKQYYAKMRAWIPEVEKFEKSSEEVGWSKNYLTDFSIHIKADSNDDEKLFEIYKDYLQAYIEMARSASPLDEQKTDKLRESMNEYVSSLLSSGGPAVDIFKTLLGPEKQREYVREIMFGMD